MGKSNARVYTLNLPYNTVGTILYIGALNIPYNC